VSQQLLHPIQHCAAEQASLPSPDACQPDHATASTAHYTVPDLEENSIGKFPGILIVTEYLYSASQ